jgi:hypothetical protein
VIKAPYREKYVWFGAERGREAQYLERWRHAPLTYTPGQAVDNTWHTDHEELLLTPAGTPALFDHARDLLLRYQFYPPTIMTHVSDFSQQGRHMRPGDRIVQRIHGPRFLGSYLFDALTMNEISAVLDEPYQAGFSYVTTQAHAEMGEWSAWVEWRTDESLVLLISAVSRLADHMPKLMSGYARRARKHAHQAGKAAFQSAVLGG